MQTHHQSAHKQLIMKVYEAFKRGDAAYILSQLSADATFDIMGNQMSHQGHFETPANIVNFFKNLATNFEITSFEVLELVEEGNVCFAVCTMGGTGRVSGKTFHTRVAHRVEINEHGLTTKFEDFSDTAAVYEAFKA